jgi:hypothetical protein
MIGSVSDKSCVVEKEKRRQTRQTTTGKIFHFASTCTVSTSQLISPLFSKQEKQQWYRDNNAYANLAHVTTTMDMGLSCTRLWGFLKLQCKFICADKIVFCCCHYYYYYWTISIAAPVYKTEINSRRDPFPWTRDTFYALKLALTSPTSGGRSVGIVRLRTTGHVVSRMSAEPDPKGLRETSCLLVCWKIVFTKNISTKIVILIVTSISSKSWGAALCGYGGRMFDTAALDSLFHYRLGRQVVTSHRVVVELREYSCLPLPPLSGHPLFQRKA